MSPLQTWGRSELGGDWSLLPMGVYIVKHVHNTSGNTCVVCWIWTISTEEYPGIVWRCMYNILVGCLLMDCRGTDRPVGGSSRVYIAPSIFTKYMVIPVMCVISTVVYPGMMSRCLYNILVFILFYDFWVFIDFLNCIWYYLSIYFPILSIRKIGLIQLTDNKNHDH